MSSDTVDMTGEYLDDIMDNWKSEGSIFSWIRNWSEVYIELTLSTSRHL